MIYDTVMTATELNSDFKFITDTPYLTIMDDLLAVYYQNFEENSPRFNGTA